MKNNKINEEGNYIVKLTESQNTKINISTVISFIFLLAYIAGVSYYFITYGFKSFFESLVIDNINSKEGAAFVIVSLPLTLIIKVCFDVITICILIIIPLLCLTNISINQKALKKNDIKYYKAMRVIGIMSLTIINSFVAKAVIDNYQSNK